MHNEVFYKLICSNCRTEEATEMYGIEGSCDGSVVKVSALSGDKSLIMELVNRLNEAELDLDLFKSTIANTEFLLVGEND